MARGGKIASKSICSSSSSTGAGRGGADLGGTAGPGRGWRAAAGAAAHRDAHRRGGAPCSGTASRIGRDVLHLADASARASRAG